MRGFIFRQEYHIDYNFMTIAKKYINLFCKFIEKCLTAIKE